MPRNPSPSPKRPSPTSDNAAAPQPSKSSSSRGERRQDASCKKCLRSIRDSHIVAMGALYHSDCFRCADCHVILKGQEFYRFLHADTVYPLCAEDFMRRQGDVCPACNGTLGKNEDAVRAANNKKYHLDHYRCKICNQRIPTKDPSALHNGELYCHFHVAIKFSPRCGGCGEAITKIGMADPDDPTRSLHENCFQIRKNYNISLRRYMPDSKGLRSNQTAYLDHEKNVNKMARRIIKHACSFEKSAVACFSSVCHYSCRYDWGQALTAANKLREHIEILRDYPQSLPKGHGFPRQTNLQHSETCRKVEKLLDMHVFKYVLAGQQTESQAARDEASEKLFALEHDVGVLVNELVRVTLDGMLTLSLGKGLPEASDALFPRLKAFPKELPRTFTSSSHSRSPSSPSIELSPHLLALPSSATSSPRSILSELSDAPIDHFYEYSGERNRESFANLPVDSLLEEIRNNSASDARTISKIIWHKEGGLLNHEFLLVQVCTPGRKDAWLRLERAAKRTFVLRKLNPASVSSRFGPDDTAKIAESQDHLLFEASTILSNATFDTLRPTLVDLGNLISCLVQESTSYTLYKENCRFFCSVIVDLLVSKFSGRFGHGYGLEHARTAPKEREAIREKWLQMAANYS